MGIEILDTSISVRTLYPFYYSLLALNVEKEAEDRLSPLFSAWKFSWLFLYVISLVISKLLGWSADIFLSVSFLSQSMPFLSAYLSLCFNKLSFITFLNIFYIWSNLVMQIIHLLALHCRYSTSITAYVASWLPYAQLYFKLSSF